MKRLSRLKTYVKDNKVPLIVGAGTVLVSYIVVRKIYTGHIYNVIATSEQLQNLIDNPNGVISFDVNQLRKVWVTNAASTEIL